MIKTVFKEIIIILLLIFAVILLLGILFYDYMPTSKIIPTRVEEYAISEETKVEIEKELNNVKSDEIVKTYTIDSSDLEVYEKSKEYNKGKVNPFEQYKIYTSEDTSGSTTNTSNSGSNNSSAKNTSTVNNNNTTNNNINTINSQNTSNSSGTFLNTKGK